MEGSGNDRRKVSEVRETEREGSGGTNWNIFGHPFCLHLLLSQFCLSNCITGPKLFRLLRLTTMNHKMIPDNARS